MTGWVGYHGAADRLPSYSQVLAGSCWASQHLLKVQTLVSPRWRMVWRSGLKGLLSWMSTNECGHTAD